MLSLHVSILFNLIISIFPKRQIFRQESNTEINVFFGLCKFRLKVSLSLCFCQRENDPVHFAILLCDSVFLQQNPLPYENYPTIGSFIPSQHAPYTHSIERHVKPGMLILFFH